MVMAKHEKKLVYITIKNETSVVEQNYIRKRDVNYYFFYLRLIVQSKLNKRLNFLSK